jgi:hypothetical protein
MLNPMTLASSGKLGIAEGLQGATLSGLASPGHLPLGWGEGCVPETYRISLQSFIV